MLSGMTLDPAEKVRINRVRRMAARQGLTLQRSRRRDPRAIDYGTYWLIETRTGAVALGDTLGVTLDEIETALLDTGVAR